MNHSPLSPNYLNLIKIWLCWLSLSIWFTTYIHFLIIFLQYLRPSWESWAHCLGKHSNPELYFTPQVMWREPYVVNSGKFDALFNASPWHTSPVTQWCRELGNLWTSLKPSQAHTHEVKLEESKDTMEAEQFGQKSLLSFPNYGSSES